MPLLILDQALLAVRRGGWERLARALLASVPLALCVIGVYYLERVEGVRSLRPLFALLLVLGYWVRGLGLSAVAREYALLIRPSLPLAEQRPGAVDICCTASVAGLGLFVWLWPLAVLSLVSPWALAGGLPVLALRGAVAPSWLARAACARERGLAAFGQAFDDTAGMRGVYLIVELLALFGGIGLFGNLYALLSFGLLLGSSMFGFELAFVSTFLSPDNAFVLLLVSALALLLLEPLRAAISAQAFVDARSRRDGADLHAMVDQAIATAQPRVRRPGSSVPPIAGSTLLFALALGAPAARGMAQAPQPTPDAIAADQAETSADAHTRAQLERILAQPEFREFAERDDGAFGTWLQKLWQSLERMAEGAETEPERERAPLPSLSPITIMTFALLALGGLGLYVATYRRTSARAARAAAPAPAELPAATHPLGLLDQAAELAARGEFREALRLLYMATLLALDRGQLIAYELHRTNGQYLRAMPQGEVRGAFAHFTRVFERTFYGRAPATRADYDDCRQLAERILGALRG